MGHINFSPDILLQSRLRKLPFQFVVEIEQKRLFEVPKSHAIYNPNLLTLEREEYHWNKLYMTENYIVYLASLIYWLQAFFLSHSIQTSTNATWTTRDVNTFVPTMKEALTVNVERDLN